MIKRPDNLRTRLGWLLPLVLLALFPPSARSAESTPSEYAVKAALIYKLSKFVEWPDPTASNETQQFGICVLGEDPFGRTLDALSAEKVRDIDIAIRRVANVDDVGEDCRIVFVSSSKERFLGLIIESLAPRPILTIGDMRKFAQDGGMIQLTANGRRIHFTINLDSARRANLMIAAPLLELSTVLRKAD